jgi:hypothetical protein
MTKNKLVNKDQTNSQDLNSHVVFPIYWNTENGCWKNNIFCVDKASIFNYNQTKTKISQKVFLRQKKIGN